MKQAKFQRIGIAIYTLTGSVLVLCWLLFKIGINGFISYLIPSLITLIIWGFYITSSVMYLYNPKKQLYTLLFQSTLIMQSVQFVLYGFTFKNYFGPYVGGGITVSPEFEYQLRVKWIDYLISNGIKNTGEIYLGINLVNLLILLLFILSKEREENPNSTQSQLE